MLRTVLFSLALAFTTPAFATGAIVDIITPADEAKLNAHETTRVHAIRAARASASTADIAIMEQVMFARPQPFGDMDITGDWQCRTMKLGGLAELVIYSWFKCRVSDDGAGWYLQKLTGSQRTSGSFYDDGETRMIYLGSGSVNDDRPLPYGSGPQSDQVGYTYRTGPAQWQIEFPAPHYESDFDVLEFRR